MRKPVVFCLVAALFLTSLALSQLSLAQKTGEVALRASESKGDASSKRIESLVRTAQENGLRPESAVAVNFAETRPLRELFADRSALRPFKYRRPITKKEYWDEQKNKTGDPRPLTEAQEAEREKNVKNRKVTRRDDPNAPSTPDEALSTKSPRGKGPIPNPPNPPTVNFEGQNIAETIAVGQGFLPPDTNGDVGPAHYVQTVNVTFRIWDKAGNPLTPVASLNTLFGPLGGACGSSEDGDPTVNYDQMADRWVISQFCTVANPNNHQLIAVSKTGDPTGAYYLYDFMMPNNKFNDYPKFGVWPDGYYMTDNQFNQAGTAFLQGGVFAFDRTKMLVGDPTASFIYFDTAVVFPPGGANGPDGIGGMLPADMEGYIPPPAGAPCPFAYFQAGEFGEPGDQLRIFDFHADFAIPANSTFTERVGSPLPVAAFDPRPVPNSRNVVPQPAPSTPASFLDAIADRLMWRLSYRNFGTTETLIVNHTVNAAVNPLFRAGVRWYQLNRSTPAGAFTITEQETWAPAGTDHRWMGSAANNFQGDVAVGYSVSSLTVNPSVRYAARLGTDTPGTGLVQGETSIVVGAGSQTSTSGRWGDYSDMVVDPSDDCSFWFTQEYYSVSSEPGNSTAPWKTRIAKFAPGPCAVSPRGTISGTVTNCQTGLPVENAFVSISGGFSRGTGAAGTYSAIVTPGTYNVSITGTGYDTASTTGLVVANGGSATFNACLNGTLKQPVADGATVTADSCNSNGFIDPNETVTVSLGVKNTGTLNTANLVGTLQATGGVTSPSGPQNYGVVVAGGATVSRSFTFTAANLACGAPVILSLQLQDGPTDLGTVTYNFTTGTIVSSNYSTGNIAVPIPDSPAPAINIPLAVADVMTLTDVNVSFRLNHTFDGDLTIALVHPDNTVIPLVTNRGSSGANFGTGTNDCAGVHTVIDDQAATAISAGAAPFAGSFRPESPLSALNGKPSNGTWNLRIQDTAGQDVGTVGCVKLELNKRSVCCGPLINASPPPVITAESFSPPNNAADPGETVTVNLSLINIGGSPTSNLVATLQPTGGVSGPSGPQNYGVLASLGPAVTRPFTFTAQGNCGSTITLTLALQDGATNLGTVTFTMTLGVLTTTTTFSENFDGVTPPALPAGWTTAATGVELPWVTSTTNPSSAPNTTFAPDVSNIGNTVLDTPTINVPGAGAQLTFRNLFNMEASGVTPTRGFDGMVLEISINGGAFNDITTGGNPFIAGGYTRLIDSTFGSPIAGRMAWSGLSGGTTGAPTYITSTINLPAAANGQPIKLRWRAATDNSAVAAGQAGVRVDTIVLSGSSFVCTARMIISEFRLRGPSGANDEFIEIYNNSDSPHTVASSDASAGYGVAASDGNLRCTIPNGTIIPARGHYLCVNSVAYSLAGYPGGNSPGTIDATDETDIKPLKPAKPGVNTKPLRIGSPPEGAPPEGVTPLLPTATGDATYTTDIPDNAGIALFSSTTNFVLARRLDAVGSTSEANTLYKEGTGYPALTPFSIDYSFYRDDCGKSGSITTMGVCSITTPKDTDNNAVDFIFVDTNGTSAGAGQRLGAPGPENLTAPIQRNLSIAAVLLDPCVGAALPPNRVRDFTSDPPNNSTFGTLDIRRTFTNNTGGNVTRMRFRIIDITTFPAPSGFADLRPRTSLPLVVTVDRPPCGSGTSNVTVQGTTLETPPSQPNGGGFNSSLSAGTITLGTPLPPGASIDLRFLLGIQQTGTFKVYVNVEALP